jgi:hypothetical protein
MVSCHTSERYLAYLSSRLQGDYQVGEAGNPERSLFAQYLRDVQPSLYELPQLSFSIPPALIWISWLFGVVAGKGRMELMDHKDPKMTMRYTRLSMELKRLAVEKLPGFDERDNRPEVPQKSPSELEPKVVAFDK